MIGRLAPVLALWVGLAAGCSDALTEAVVRVDSDLAVPSALDEVRFEIDASAIDERVISRAVSLTDGEAELPVTLTLVHDGGALGPVEVTAIGLRQGTEIVSRTARFHFLRGRTLTVQLDLDRRCISQGCETVAPDGGADAGPGTSLDGGPVSEPGNADAGPTGELDAHEGSNVRDIRCNEGATCDFDASGASNVAVKCEHGSTCFVDCTNASNCEVQCKDSSCLVECAGTSDCEITECEDEVLRCGSQLACGRACP